MRFVAPARDAIDPVVFTRPPLREWSEFDSLLRSSGWPDLATLELIREQYADAANGTLPHFVEQTPPLLRDGLHYELRIAQKDQIATRSENWHDLLNALIWLRYPALKAALNARQVSEIARVGSKQRSRAQCALTHFDEAGVIVHLQDENLLALWDAHDWHGLFWRERAAWSDGRISVQVFGHALLEHALKPGQLLVGKSLAVCTQSSATEALATVIRAGDLLNDPQHLRPLPLSGIPGWLADNDNESFYFDAPCFAPLRAGRRYPPLVRLS